MISCEKVIKEEMAGGYLSPFCVALMKDLRLDTFKESSKFSQFWGLKDKMLPTALFWERLHGG